MAFNHSAAHTAPRQLSSAAHTKSVARVRHIRKSAAAAVDLPTTQTSSHLLEKYAVLSLGGIQQLVQEGEWYCCDNNAFAQTSATSSDGKVFLNRVLAWKHNGQFLRGRPFLKDVIVEAQVLEEFTAPCSCKPGIKDSEAPSGKQQVVKKFLVTRIASQ